MILHPLAADSPGLADALPATLAVLFLAAILFGVLRYVRKKIKQPESRTPGGFTLSDLRQLVKEGKMTPEEFDRAKNLILDANKRAVEIRPAQETLAQKREGRGEEQQSG